MLNRNHSFSFFFFFFLIFFFLHIPINVKMFFILKRPTPTTYIINSVHLMPHSDENEHIWETVYYDHKVANITLFKWRQDSQLIQKEKRISYTFIQCHTHITHPTLFMKGKDVGIKGNASQYII